MSSIPEKGNSTFQNLLRAYRQPISEDYSSTVFAGLLQRLRDTAGDPPPLPPLGTGAFPRPSTLAQEMTAGRHGGDGLRNAKASPHVIKTSQSIPENLKGTKMDHSTHTELVDSDLTEENLLGALVYGSGGETIGTVSHVHGLGAATRVVVDVGGFLGIGTRPVALTTNQLNFMRDEDGIVHASTAWTKEHILELPEHRH